MNSPGKRFRQRLATLPASCGGLSYVEFAFTAPLLIMALTYGLELANIAIMHARISNLAGMMADGAARVRDSIDESDINELFIGAGLAAGTGNITQHGRILVSTLEDNAATATTTDQIITWQRCKGKKKPTSTFGKEGDVVTDGVGKIGNKISASVGNPVVFVEVIYDYQPLISNSLFGAMEIRYASAFSVRDRVSQTLRNGANLSATQKATCNYFTA